MIFCNALRPKKESPSLKRLGDGAADLRSVAAKSDIKAQVCNLCL